MDEHTEFAGYERAELRHARGLSTAEAEQICGRYLQGGSWAKDPNGWGLLAQRTSLREDATRSALAWFDTWLDAVVGDEIGPTHQQVLRECLGWGLICVEALLDARIAVADKLVNWMCARAGPGGAACCADVLQNANGLVSVGSSDDEDIAARKALWDRFVPLARHLVSVGSGELRSRARSRLMLDIIAQLDEHGPPQTLVAAFELMIATDQGEMMWNRGRGRRSVWRVTEGALEAGLQPSRCWDIVTWIGGEGSESREVWAPIIKQNDLPRCAAALFAGLASGGIPDKVASGGWIAVVLALEPTQVQPLTERTHALCCAGVRECLSIHEHYGQLYLCTAKVERARLGRWVAFAADTIIRLAGPAGAYEARRFITETLTPLVSWSSNFEDIGANRPIAASLTKWVAEAPAPWDRSLELAAKILRENPEPTYAASAALESLAVGVGASRHAEPSTILLDELLVEFERLLLRQWWEPVFGVDVRALAAGVTNLAFESSETAEQVARNGATIVLRPDYYRDLLRRDGLTNETKALSMLYFVHELLHLPQGVGELQRVQQLRSTGVEMTLMHLDLTADHAATLIVNRAVPSWPVTWLKRLVFRSLESFPASRFHTHAARHRKAVRLVSTRADILVRERPDSIMPDAAGYCFVEYGPAGGSLFVLASGPPMRVLAHVGISTDESATLNAAADPQLEPQIYLAKVDEILGRLVKTMAL